MNKTILQVPLSKALRHDAESAALAQGFSSLQEVVRVFLSRLAEKKIEVSIQESVALSAKAEKRYVRMREDFQNKKNVYTANTVKDLIKQLNENQLS